MELLGSSRGAMPAFSSQAREFSSKVSLVSEFFTKRSSLLLAPPLSPVWLNSPGYGRRRGTICKQKTNSSSSGRRHRPAGKKLEERATEFWGDEKSHPKRKSRAVAGSRKGNGGDAGGSSSRSTRSSKRNEADELESSATPSHLLENGDGAIAVSTLQPLDEVYYPMADLSIRIQPAFRRRSESIAAAAESSGNSSSSSLPNEFEELVLGRAGARTGPGPAATGQSANNNGNGVLKESVEEILPPQPTKLGGWNGRISPSSVGGFRGAAAGAAAYEEWMEGPSVMGFAEDSESEEEDEEEDKEADEEEDEEEEDEEDDYDEWVEVGVDDVGDEEEVEEEEEEVEYWEGDLPPMTPEDEEELLREAERELAELEKDPEYEFDPSKAAGAVAADSALKGVLAKKRLNPRGGRGGDERPHVLSASAEERPWRKSESDGSIGRSADFRGEEWRDDDSCEGKRRVIGEGGAYEDYGDEKEEDEDEDEEVRIELKRVDLQGRRPKRRSFWEGNDDDYEEEEKEEEGGEPKGQRGVPAVMRCFDRAKIYVKAGDGGNGVVAFRREKFVPFGGPSGGNGGRGGQVFVEADSSMNSLLPFRKTVHFRAGRGVHGGGKRKEGAVGTDCTVKVPPGTVIREAGPEGKVLLEITKAGQRETLLPGGSGGRGNAAFKTGRNNAPQLAELGETGAETWVELELKLVADVGIVGVPNAGKSTLLSAISAAKPEIANYPFTTLLPNLGVVALDYDATMVVADLPGLLEGAHTGTGLGHEFLRHTERCRVLVHVVDGMSSQPVEEFEAVRLELELFDSALAEKPFVVAFNKMDIPEASERWESFRLSLLRSKGIEPFCISAATKQGTSEVVSAAHQLLKEMKENPYPQDDIEEKAKAMAVAERVKKQRSAPLENFTIEIDKHTRTWQVVGAGLERFTQMTNWEYFESVRRFQRVLSASGVSRALREKGIREGDTVIVAQMEFNWMESEDMTKLQDWKRGNRGSKVWPH